MPGAVARPPSRVIRFRRLRTVTRRGRSPAAGRRLILLYHARRDAPARADRDAVVFRPGPDVTGALAARRGPGRPARLRPPGLPRVLDEWRQLLSERGRVLLAQ